MAYEASLPYLTIHAGFRIGNLYNLDEVSLKIFTIEERNCQDRMKKQKCLRGLQKCLIRLLDSVTGYLFLPLTRLYEYQQNIQKSTAITDTKNVMGSNLFLIIAISFLTKKGAKR